MNGKSPIEQLFGYAASAHTTSPSTPPPQQNGSTQQQMSGEDAASASPEIPSSPSSLAAPGGGKRRRHKTTKPEATAGHKSCTTPGTPQTPPAKRAPPPPADMTLFVTRTDLFDAGKYTSAEGGASTAETPQPQPSPSSNLGYPRPPVGAYQYYSPSSSRTFAAKPKEPDQNSEETHGTVVVCRVSHHHPSSSSSKAAAQWMQFAVVDKCTPNPTGDAAITKYWNQRRRLFSRFDQGILLDQEGWFSVTPEQIADHVASRTVELASSNSAMNGTAPAGITVLDAFCGCGGNSIAFAKQTAVQQVICCDIDRSKLQRAANNAAIYQIPVDKILFIDCNVLFLLEHCYKNGAFILDHPIETPEAAMALMSAMPPPVPTETCHGYQIGGIDLLPRKIDVVFLDPPWGGQDYSVFGKHGYCLQRNMRIPRPVQQQQHQNASSSREGVGDGFFDTFAAAGPRNKKERKAAFNCGLDESNCVNGAELLQLAAAAAANGWVVYDIPRNTNRTSLAQSALMAGYYGNCKLEEHYLNGRLKTVSAYFGCDWRSTLLISEEESIE